jgi:hypothetical protein
MKHIAIVTMILAFECVALAASPVAPRSGASKPGLFELGLNLGEPTGVSAKLWLDRTSALEGIAAWAFTQGAFALSVDYLLNFSDAIKVETEVFTPFVGIGGVVRFSSRTADVQVGIRIPLGILYAFRDVPLEISLDIVPGLNLFPDTTLLAMGGIGIRYCF